MRKFLIIITFLLLVATSALLWLTEGASTSTESTETLDSQGSGQALIGGAYTLTDHNGNAVSDKAFLGKVGLVFFGFTHCPDICPTASATITGAMKKLGEKADQVTPLFITVDPERDTPETLKKFLSSFDKRFVGLTGTPEQLAQAASAYKVYYAKSAGEGSMGFDHSGFIYLMDRKGTYIRHFASDATDAEIADAIEPLLN
jgi:protein SCO1/2